MPRYTVDVKAFITVTVEAPDENAARKAADHYVETSCSPSEDEVTAWEIIMKDEGEPAWPVSAGEFCVDGFSEVEEEEE
ncbi:hypothetical protein ACQKOE_07385 [Novosphingobium sp. NPDC080210]|uniref:hypothetical protein n=1 Tax=Novosphingobium sp. NPDC080210 TaxID=3390596 RepID=UPI003D033B2F